MKTLLLLSLLFGAAFAKVLVSPVEAMQENFSPDAKIVKKNILLHSKQAHAIQNRAKVKLSTKIYRTYKALNNGKVEGYGILINKKVRSKNAVVLYIIKDDVLTDIEIIAFNEPAEFMPTKGWLEQFKARPTDKNLTLNRDIPTVTGATLSARVVTDGSRVAFALYNEVLQGK